MEFLGRSCPQGVPGFCQQQTAEPGTAGDQATPRNGRLGKEQRAASQEQLSTDPRAVPLTPCLSFLTCKVGRVCPSQVYVDSRSRESAHAIPNWRPQQVVAPVSWQVMCHQGGGQPG